VRPQQTNFNPDALQHRAFGYNQLMPQATKSITEDAAFSGTAPGWDWRTNVEDPGIAEYRILDGVLEGV
jgi:hypothetical protein